MAFETETTKPRENPGSPLRAKTVVWCHVPLDNEDGSRSPARRKTPVIVVGVNRNEDGSARSITALYTSLARAGRYDDPLVFRVDQEDQKRRMGVGEDDRAVRLRKPLTIPFDKAHFGDAPEISGRVPDHLWKAMTGRVMHYNAETAIRRQTGRSVSSLYGWSNLPAPV